MSDSTKAAYKVGEVWLVPCKDDNLHEATIIEVSLAAKAIKVRFENSSTQWIEADVFHKNTHGRLRAAPPPVTPASIIADKEFWYFLAVITGIVAIVWKLCS